MKTIRIYKRNVTVRTGYRKYPYKEVIEYIVAYDGKEYSNCLTELSNTRLKVRFKCVFETRTFDRLKDYRMKLGYSEADKWLKAKIDEIITEIQGMRYLKVKEVNNEI